ncbi:MAG: NEW3 domain-containing protein [Gemmatimonadaceae bacterium]|nr:NEW3 domain-containing protein [Gemmatimonadaceae bacterium]
MPSRSRSSLVTLAGAVLALAVVVAPARAQQPFGTSGSSAASIARDPDGGIVVRRASALRYVADAGAVRVVSVPVPEQFSLTERVDWDLVDLGVVPVLGRNTGALPAGDERRRVTFSLQVLNQLSAGVHTVAAVRFRSASVGAIEVPVELQLQPNRLVHLQALRTVLGVRPGQRVTVPVQVRNGGNQSEVVALRLRAPADWRVSEVEPQTRVVAARRTQARDLVVEVPANASDGDWAVEVHADGFAEVPESRLLLSFRISSSIDGQDGAPVLRLSGATSATTTGALTAGSVELSGELIDGVQVNGLYTAFPAAGDVLALRSLGRLRFTPGAASLSLSSRRWGADVGLTGVNDQSVIGTNVWGLGGSARYDDETYRARVVAARPSGIAAGAGQYLIGSAGRRIGDVYLGGRASQLEDTQLGGRRLSAAGLELQLPTTHGGVDVGLAYRDFGVGSGLGALLRAEHRAEQVGGSVLFASAPGGARGFARVEHEFSATAFLRPRADVTLSTSLWQTRDGAAVGQPSRAAGLTLGPQWRVTDAFTVSVDVRSTSFTSSGLTTVFGNRENAIAAGAQARLRGFELQGAVSRGRFANRSGVTGIPLIERSAERMLMSGSVSRLTQFGAFEFDASLDRAGAGIGLPASQLSTSLRADRVPLPKTDSRVFLRGEIARLAFADQPTPFTSLVAGVDVLLPAGFTLALDAERNTMFRSSVNGPTPWAATIRLTRGAPFAMLGRRGVRGTVFEDRNGNGVRDRGERGIAGAIVRSGTRSIVAESNGRFVAMDTTATYDVDPRSLPAGWVAAPRAIEDKRGRLDLPVLPTAPVTFVITLRTDGPMMNAPKWERAVVVLRDAAGREWTSGLDAAQRSVFDALPEGDYAVELDLTALGEPLRVDGALPRVQVRGGAAAQVIPITVAPRPVRRIGTPPRTSSVYVVPSSSSGSAQP